MTQDINSFLIKATEIANYLSAQSFVRIFSHNDTDGVIGACILMKAFNRKNIQYHTTFISRIDFEFIEKYKKDLESYIIVFSDIGSIQSSFLSPFKNIVILDHHIYSKFENEYNNYFLNSEDFEISGSFNACASSICYIVSKFMDYNNCDLSSIALIGIDGDRQVFEGINNIVLNDAIDNNLIEKKYGYKLGNDTIYNTFFTSIEPYLSMTGNMELINSFFLNLNIENKKMSLLSDDEIKRFEIAIFSELEKYSCENSMSFIFGIYYNLKNKIIENIHDFSSMITSCCQNNRPSLGVALCFEDNLSLTEIKSIYSKTKKCLVDNFLLLLNTKKELNFVYYFYGKNIVSSGEIASSLIRYRYPSKVVVCFNETNFGIKVSGRCSIQLINKGINLSIAFSKASKYVGGTGGGHAIASGGFIPIGTSENFVLELDDILEKQIAKNI